MKRTVLGVLAAVAVVTPSMGQSLNDQVILANDGLFLQRVRQSLITQSINIASDGLSTAIALKRHAQVQQILTNPDAWKSQFAAAIATQAAVNGPATTGGTVVLRPMICPGLPTPPCVETGNADAQQALVSDTVINTNVSAVYNAFFGGQ